MDKYLFTKHDHALMEGMRVPFAVYQFIDSRVVTIVLSDGFCELFGYTDKAEAYRDMDRDMYKDTHPDDVARIADEAYRFATEGGTYDAVYRTKIKTGGYRMIHAIGEHVFTKDGVRLAYVWYTDEGLWTENSEQETGILRAMNHALNQASVLVSDHYDYLTGLPGIAYFFKLAQKGSERIMSEGGKPVMLFMDLIGMKLFNTHNGFAEGDALLTAFAKELSRVFSNESCCRVGSDHFAVYTDGNGLDETLTAFFEECKQLNGGNSLPVRVGVYPFSGEHVPPGLACDRAKLACDTIRRRYVSSYVYFDPVLQENLEKRQYVLDNLDTAIAEKWIQVYYQPIIRAVNGKMCDEEALARWIDPVKGFLSPADFIPALEDAGLIYKLDLYVVEQVLEKLCYMRAHGLRAVPQSVNLSRVDFTACDIVEEIRRRVDEAGISRSMLSIEITESVIGAHYDFMKAQVERFQALGFPVWMDDFGSGYSAMNMLQSIRFDLIKFDMSFLRRLDEGESGKIILTELMKLATALGLDTVCEGVENEAQEHFLREIGCSKLQGYYFSKPSPLQTVVEWTVGDGGFGVDNPDEVEYFELIGRANLQDLSTITSGSDNFNQYFNSLPMTVFEFRGEEMRYARTNRSYRDFVQRFFGVKLTKDKEQFRIITESFAATFLKEVRRCCLDNNLVILDEKTADGSTVHTIARRLGTNPVTGAVAVAAAVLSITDEPEGATYEDIALTLASDYFHFFYVNLDTETYFEYTSPDGGEPTIKRREHSFFRAGRREAQWRIAEKDRERFLECFTKENILHELDSRGVFTMTYGLLTDDEPLTVRLKILRARLDVHHIVAGVSVVDRS